MKNLVNIWKTLLLEEKILWIYILLLPLTGVAHFKLGPKRIGYIDFIFVIVLVLWLLKYLSGKVQFQRSSLELPLLLLLVSFSCSFINSRNLFDSLIELAGLIYLILLFLLVINVVSNQQKFCYILRLFLFVSTVVSLGGLFFFALALISGETSRFLFYTTIESVAHHFPRIRFTFEGPNMMATYLHVSIIAGIILFILEKNRNARFLITSCIIIILIAAIFTGSRRFTGLLLTAFIILCWYGKGKVISVLKYVFLFGFIVFFIASLVTSIWVLFPLEITKDVDAKTVGLQVHRAYSIHFLQLSTALLMFKQHPLIGVGFGTYHRHFKDYVDWQWARSSLGFAAYPELIAPVEDKTLILDPHSLCLGTLAETGIIGFVGLLYFLIAYFIMLKKKIKGYSRKGNLRTIACGCLLAGFIGFLLNGIVTDILSMRHFWFMLALGVIAGRLNET